jgi:hypothetical protein
MTIVSGVGLQLMDATCIPIFSYPILLSNLHYSWVYYNIQTKQTSHIKAISGLNNSGVQNRNPLQHQLQQNQKIIIIETKKLFMVVNCQFESIFTYNFSATTIPVHAINTNRCCDYSNKNDHNATKSIHHPSLPIALSTTQSCRNIATFHPQSLLSNFFIIFGLLKPNSTKTRIRSGLLFWYF